MMSMRGGARARAKPDGSPVTDADLAVDAMLRERLTAARPTTAGSRRRRPTTLPAWRAGASSWWTPSTAPPPTSAASPGSAPRSPWWRTAGRSPPPCSRRSWTSCSWPRRAAGPSSTAWRCTFLRPETSRPRAWSATPTCCVLPRGRLRRGAAQRPRLPPGAGRVRPVRRGDIAVAEAGVGHRGGRTAGGRGGRGGDRLGGCAAPLQHARGQGARTGGVRTGAPAVDPGADRR